MTDQCKHCAYHGDFAACKVVECFQHENWYARQMQAENANLKNQLSLCDAVEVDHLREVVKWLSIKLVFNGISLEVLPTEAASQLNKIKADAVRGAANELCIKGDSVTPVNYTMLHKYANRLEGKEC